MPKLVSGLPLMPYRCVLLRDRRVVLSSLLVCTCLKCFRVYTLVVTLPVCVQGCIIVLNVFSIRMSLLQVLCCLIVLCLSILHMVLVNYSVNSSLRMVAINYLTQILIPGYECSKIYFWCFTKKE